MESELDVLVVDADLMGVGRLEAAATVTGANLRMVSAAALDEALRDAPGDLLILDLDRGREKALDVLDEVKAHGLLPARVVAYVSHVDEALVSSARERGYEALPRGRFWRSLEELLSRP